MLIQHEETGSISEISDGATIPPRWYRVPEAARKPALLCPEDYQPCRHGSLCSTTCYQRARTIMPAATPEPKINAAGDQW